MVTHYWSIQSWLEWTPDASHFYLHIEDERTSWVDHIPFDSKALAAKAAVRKGREYRAKGDRLLSKRSKYR